MKHLPLDLSHFTNFYDTKPKPHVAKTFPELCERLSQSRELAVKENGDLWSPARYRQGTTRANANVESVSSLVLDFDDVKRSQWEPFLEPFEYFAHTTHSHTAEHECWRVVVVLPAPVAGNAWTEFWLHANDALGTLSDDACKDPARFYYYPATKHGGVFESFHHDGIPFDVTCQPPRDAFTQHSDDLRKRREKQRLNSVSRVLSTWDAEKRHGRHVAARTAVLALERLRENGASVDDALARIHREFVSMILDRCSPEQAEKEWNGLVEGAKEITSTPSTQRHSVSNTTTTLATTPEPKSESVDTTPPPTDDDKGRETVAEKLVRLGRTNYDFTLGDDGEPYAIPRHGSSTARHLRRDTFQNELSALYLDETEKVANAGAMRRAVDTLAGLAQRAGRRTVQRSNDDEQRPESVAERLVELGTSLYDFTVGDDGEPLAVPREGSPLAKPIRGNYTFQDELSARYFDDTGKVANSNALKEAVNVFAGFAQRNERQNVYYRRAHLVDRIVIDLGERDGAVGEITANGWRILDVSPVVFRRAETLGRLPRPSEPDLDKLRELIPADEQAFRDLVGWLVATYFDEAQPILFLDAPQGAGKTSTAKILKRLTDPSPVEVSDAPRDAKQWRTIATNAHVVILDNLSRILAWLSDALCRAVTGDAVIERGLFTDNTPKVYAFQRPVVLTSIHLRELRGDLTERLLYVPLQRIPDEQRRSQRELDEHFDKHVPAILAALWRLVAGVLLQRRKIKNAPRMADYGEILHALDNVTGWDTFARYTQNVRDLLASGANDDEVGRWLLEFAPATGTVTYYTHELFQELQLAHKQRNVSPTFPKDSGELGTRLSNLQENLRRAGVLVERATRSARGNRWTLSRVSAGSAGSAGLSLFPSVGENTHTQGTEKESA